jgi:ubiquinone/menaquinone biosynthesis C-methylase UbiE
MHSRTAHTAPSHTRGLHGSLDGPIGTLAGLTMVWGRRKLVDWLVETAAITPATTLVDVGCGPGSAARAAARRGAAVTGIDPSPSMLALARRFTSRGLRAKVQWQLGTAEQLPVPDATANVIWAVASAHHWEDVDAGLRECHRVAAPGGALFVVEGDVKPGAKGHAAHGFTAERVDSVAASAFDAGFAEVHVERVWLGHREYYVVQGRSPA